MIHFISYYDSITNQNNAYFEGGKRTYESAIKQFDDVTIYTREMLEKEDFYQDNKKILDLKPHAGYCLWKPFYIQKKLSEMNDGDMLFYMDVGDILQNGSFKNYLVDVLNKNKGFFLVKTTHTNITWTTKDCFFYMDCDNEKYWYTGQLEAGNIGLIKNTETVKFVNEWLFFCQDENILTKNYINENYKEYCGDNRADQSVLTNLHIKYNIPTVPFPEIQKYIRH